MKSRLIFAVGAACMFAVIGMAHSQGLQQSAQPSMQPAAQPAMQQNAAGPAQSSTDASYGGVPATRSVAGGMRSKPCRSGPQCDIFFGH
jgi:Tfp pilus assembly protein PilV